MRASGTTILPLGALAVLAVSVIAAGFFAPYDAATQFREHPFAPPSRVHIFDHAGKFHMRPFVDACEEGNELQKYQEDRSCSATIHFFVIGNPYSILGMLRSRLHLFGVDEPAHLFLFGSDSYGRDQFSRFLFGGQISLFSGLLAASLSLALALLLGAAAGYHGGVIDAALMRATEVFAALPWLYLLLGLRAFLPLHLGPAQTFFLLVGIIGILGWGRPARLVRGIVLSGKERNYVLSAKGFGAGDFYLLRRHILPQTRSVILTQAAVLLPQFILAEVTLSFLGLGVAEPVPSWGNMLSSLQEYSVLSSHWWMMIPAVLLFPFFLGCHWLTQSLDLRIESTPYHNG